MKGFGSKIKKKMGYKGQGLRKDGKGRRDPIEDKSRPQYTDLGYLGEVSGLGFLGGGDF